MIEFIILGFGLGASAGFSPGPLTALAISETLQHNVRSGMLVSLSPLVTDAPIIFLCFLLTSQFSDMPFILALLGMLGGCYLIHLGLKNFRMKEFTLPEHNVNSFSLYRGMVTNVLNPNPYIFWTTIGVPILARAWGAGPTFLLAFLLSFYLPLISIKSGFAVITHYSKHLLTGKIFVIVNRVMGGVLFLFALFLWMDALRRLGLLKGLGFHP